MLGSTQGLWCLRVPEVAQAVSLGASCCYTWTAGVVADLLLLSAKLCSLLASALGQILLFLVLWCQRESWVMCKESKAGAGSVSRCRMLREDSGLGGELPFPCGGVVPLLP